MKSGRKKVVRLCWGLFTAVLVWKFWEFVYSSLGQNTTWASLPQGCGEAIQFWSGKRLWALAGNPEIWIASFAYIYNNMYTEWCSKEGGGNFWRWNDKKRKPHCMIRCSGVMGDGGHAVRRMKRYFCLHMYHNVENLQEKNEMKNIFFGNGWRTRKCRFLAAIFYDISAEMLNIMWCQYSWTCRRIAWRCWIACMMFIRLSCI